MAVPRISPWASPAAAQICLSAKQNEPPPAQSALYFFSRLNK